MKTTGLGGWWFAYGIFRITTAVLLVVFSSTAHLMFGALLTRVPRPLPVMYSFQVLYWIVIAWCVVSAILSVLAAGMLFVESRPAATLARIAAFVSLPDIPFGLVLGTYTLLKVQGVRVAETNGATARSR